jgi:hypothetical protein
VLGEVGTAGEPGDLAAVDGVVERAPDPRVVERGRAHVEEHVVHFGDGVGV